MKRPHWLTLNGCARYVEGATLVDIDNPVWPCIGCHLLLRAVVFVVAVGWAGWWVLS